jgi:hypothetical protein
VFIEDLFQTWLYTSTGSDQTITNGINLSGNGGLVWVKGRNAVKDNVLVDTVRGVSRSLVSNSTAGEDFSSGNYVNAFSSTGFGVGGIGSVGGSGNTFATWTFREQPKFFDIVTWTGDGTQPRTINHNLGSAPGCILVKRVSGGFGEDWQVYHRSLSAGQNLVLNTTAAATTQTPNGFGAVTSTTFELPNAGAGNSSGYPYIAYLFAHNAGGFPASGAGSTNGISCGSFTTNGSSAATVTLGYEPQWILTKRTDGTGAWGIYDTMRGWSFSGQNFLLPNSSGAEGTINGANFVPTATGFNISAPYDASATYIYIAIRRGPMKVPTTGTSVFFPAVRAGTGAPASITGVGFPPDWALCQGRPLAIGDQVQDKLRGATRGLQTQSDNEENSAPTDALLSFGQDGINVGANTTSSYWNNAAVSSYVYYYMRRAPGFMDVVCYTGTGSATTQTHNLGVVPELTIIKNRSSAGTGWITALTVGGLSWTSGNFLRLELTNGTLTNTAVLNTTPTSTVFSIPSGNTLNNLGDNYVAYLFATVAGVSKVGSFTGTGALQTVNCGFAAGARFVLIKRTDSTGDWFFWDSARGITSGNDPYLLLNSTAVEVTNTNYVDTTGVGFQVTAAAPAGLNASGGNYIFLAIA